MAFSVLTKKYEVDKCFLSTLHYMVGNNSKNDIYLIDRRTDFSDYIDKKESIKKFNVFSICVINKNNNEEGYKCFINMDILFGAIHSFDFSKFDGPLDKNQKLSIVLCVRFIDALYRTGIGNGLSTKDCMDRVLTLYKYDNSDKNDKHILNVARVKPDQFYSYSKLYNVDTDYIESIINKLKLKNCIRIIDNSVKERVLDGYKVTPVLKSILPIEGVQIVHLKNEKYGFINLSMLDYFIKGLPTEDVKNIMSSTLKLKNEYGDEDVKSIYRLFMVLYALQMDLSQHPTDFNPSKNISNNIIGIINTELVLNENAVLNCIRIKNK